MLVKAYKNVFNFRFFRFSISSQVKYKEYLKKAASEGNKYNVADTEAYKAMIEMNQIASDVTIFS